MPGFFFPDKVVYIWKSENVHTNNNEDKKSIDSLKSATLLKRDSDTSVFLWILRNF